MENATRAMLMGAGILLGILLLSLLIYVFTAGGKMAQDYDINQNKNQLQYFNSKLFEYDKVIRLHDDSISPTGYETVDNIFRSRGNTINEVVSAINLAYDYNKSFSHIDGSYDEVNRCLIVICDASGTVAFELPNNYQEQYKIHRNTSVEGLTNPDVSVSDLLRLRMNGNSYSMNNGEKLSDMKILNSNKGESLYRFYFETSIHINESTQRIDRMAFIPVRMDGNNHNINTFSGSDKYGLTSSYVIKTVDYGD